MLDSKLISIYLALNSEELRKLRKWMNSDFVNKNEDVLSFFKFVDSRKSINEKSITKQKAHDFLYPNMSYDDLRIRHLMWMTSEVMESFIVQIGLEKDINLKEKLLAKFYINKGLLPFANKTIENAIETVNKEPVKKAEHYKDLYDLGWAFYAVNSRNNRTEDFDINASIYSFTVYTIVEVLKSASALNTIQKVMEFEAKQYLLQPILDMLPDSVFMDLPIVRIYYNAYLSIANEDEKTFQVFLVDIKQNEKLFSPQELNSLYRTAINFCVKKLNQNDKHCTEKAFELYMYTIEKGILIENNEINRFVFTNTVTLGIRLNEFEKLDVFIKKYSEFIHDDYKENTIYFNTAKLLYAKNQYNESLKIFLMNEFKDTIWNLNAKFIIAKIYFEINDMKSFQFHLKSFKIYIKRKSNIGYHKTYFTNVTDALTKLSEVYKTPEKYRDFIFDSKTPDVDWFNKMLDKIRVEYK